MSSPAFDAPLDLDLRPSRALRTGLIALHLGAAAGLLIVPLPWAVGGGLLLAISLVAEWRRSGRICVLRWCGDDRWELPGAETAAGRLHRATFLSPWLVVLALHDGRRIHRWPLFRDALPPTQWRRLRARLRVQGAALADPRDTGAS